MRLFFASAGTETQPPVARPRIRVRSRPSDREIDPAGDWLCAWCLNPVAREADRFSYDGQSELTFTNPAGISYRILTFSKTIGCREMGTPTLAYTWFPDHAWTFCQCVRCGSQLGWHYSGPKEFDGLIADQIVRAAAAMS